MTTVNVIESVEVRVIDGLAAYIEENAGLDPYNVVLYKRPVAVFPEDCPLMCIWLLTKQYGTLTTAKSHDPMMIGITWQKPCIERAETLQSFPEDAKDLLRDLKKIEAAIKELAGFGPNPFDSPTLDNVPELDMILPGGVDYMPPLSVETGLVEGYAMTVEVTVNE